MNEYRLIIQPEAELDLLAARDWYDSQRTGLGREFIESIDEALSQIRRMLMTFSVAYRGYRQYIVRRFLT